MRSSLLIVLPLLVFTAPLPARAHPAAVPGLETAAPQLEDAAGRRCARGYHFVRAHRLADGRPVRAKCVRNRPVRRY